MSNYPLWDFFVHLKSQPISKGVQTESAMYQTLEKCMEILLHELSPRKLVQEGVVYGSHINARLGLRK